MSSAPLFSDRIDAGEQLAQWLLKLITSQRESGLCAPPIVYALPRGGIPVGAVVAHQLDCPLDIVVAKKITTPQNPELAIGAVTSEGHVLWSQQTLPWARDSKMREAALRHAQEKAQAQLNQFSVSRPQVNPQGALALLVDDGIATGMTIAAAAQALKEHHLAHLWICSPVAPVGLATWLSQWSDRVVVLKTPDPFFSVSRFYANFPQVSTEEALICLKQHNHFPHNEVVGNAYPST